MHVLDKAEAATPEATEAATLAANPATKERVFAFVQSRASCEVSPAS